MGRIDTVLPEPLTRGLDATEILAFGNFGNLYLRRGSWPFTIARGSPLMASGLTAIGGAGVAGTGFTPARAGGLWWWRGVSGTRWINGRYLDDFQWPVGKDYSVLPTEGEQPMEYTFEGLCVVEGAGTVGAPFMFGLFSGGTMFDVDTQPGFVVFTSKGTSANWLVLRRARAAGAMVTVDTGIPFTTPIYVQVKYRNDTNPEIFALVNGVEFGRATGLANVPQLADGTTANWHVGFVQGNQTNSVPAQVFRVTQCRIIAEELPGYE